jgi:hypothetical protein
MGAILAQEEGTGTRDRGSGRREKGEGRSEKGRVTEGRGWGLGVGVRG